jgi:hypothetical protein
VPDNRWAFPGNPDAWLSGRIVGITPMLPIPAKAGCFGSVGAVRPAVQSIHAPAILWSEAIDFRHEPEL